MVVFFVRNFSEIFSHNFVCYLFLIFIGYLWNIFKLAITFLSNTCFLITASFYSSYRLLAVNFHIGEYEVYSIRLWCYNAVQGNGVLNSSSEQHQIYCHCTLFLFQMFRNNPHYWHSLIY